MVITPGASVMNPVTGNVTTGPSVESEWWGLIQQRFIDTQQRQIQDAVTLSEYVAMLEPGAPVTAASSIRGEDGRRYEIVGFPRARRRVTGQRRPVYTAAYINLVSDSQETP